MRPEGWRPRRPGPWPWPRLTSTRRRLSPSGEGEVGAAEAAVGACGLGYRYTRRLGTRIDLPTCGTLERSVLRDARIPVPGSAASETRLQNCA